MAKVFENDRNPLPESYFSFKVELLPKVRGLINDKIVNFLCI